MYSLYEVRNLWVNDMNILFKHFFKTFFLKILFFSNLYTQCRAQTHNLQINIPILDKVSQPGAPDVNILEYIALSELLEHSISFLLLIELNTVSVWPDPVNIPICTHGSSDKGRGALIG